MTRVVITGLGMVSSLGCTLPDVVSALREGRSGLRTVPELRSAGLPGAVHAPVRGFDADRLDPRTRRTMSVAAQYGVVAAQAALSDAALSREQLDPDRTAVIVGGELGGIDDLLTMRRQLHSGRKSRSGATGVTRAMDSSASGNIAAVLGLRGRATGLVAGTGSGLAAIRYGAQLITWGLADRVLCGASEEESWRFLGPSLARCRAWPRGYDDQPERACRPFDAARHGTVLSAGAAVFLLEPAEKARQRGAQSIIEVLASGSAGDGVDTLHPSGRGLRAAISTALSHAREADVTSIDHVHAGAEGTPVGDAVEAAALRDLFGNQVPVSSTTGLTGCAVGASGAIRVGLSLLMLREQFLAPTTNLDVVADDCQGLQHVRQPQATTIRTVLCTAASFGSFNECLILRRLAS